MKRHLYPIDPISGKEDKTHTIWEEICSMENLKLAHQNASKGKKWYKEVREFNKDPEKYLKQIQTMLVMKTYKPLPYFKFIRVERGKEREIYKSKYFPERVIQWAVLQVISPILLRQFIYDTYSAIPERGIHLALKRVLEAVQNDQTGTQCCLKMDVKKYYPSIDREILIQDYERLFKDEDLLWYLRLNIRESPDTGIPIGNYLSQFSGNFYLSSFDHWIKEVKGVKYYYRYMDDIVILHESKEYLQQLRVEIIEYLAENKHLTIKGNHQVFYLKDRGLDFVGYRIFPDFVLLRSSTANRMKTKLTNIRQKVESGSQVTYSEYCSFNSYKGWLLYCNSHRLYVKYFEPLEKTMEEYHDKHLKNGGRKHDKSRKCKVYCETPEYGVRQLPCVS